MSVEFLSLDPEVSGSGRPGKWVISSKSVERLSLDYESSEDPQGSPESSRRGLVR